MTTCLLTADGTTSVPAPLMPMGSAGLFQQLLCKPAFAGGSGGTGSHSRGVPGLQGVLCLAGFVLHNLFSPLSFSASLSRLLGSALGSELRMVLAAQAPPG